MYVIKESGEKEKLNLKKLKQSILSAGASESLANKTIRELKKKAYPGINTKQILKIVLNLLKAEPGVAQRYNLKRAIMILGPTGFLFEKFIARVLKEYGYKTKTNVIVRGVCVKQEVDVLAIKGNKKYMIECKYHNAPGKKSELKVVMYTYARFLDIRHKHFDEPWLITNTKCTTEAIKYSRCMNLKIIGWDYPKKDSLELLLERKNIYPITTLLSLTPHSRQKLVKANIMLVNDLVKFRVHYLRLKTRLSKKTLLNLREEARHIINKD